MLCNRIKALRKEKKITQEEMAARIGIDRASLSRIESGVFTPSTENLLKIANYLEVSVDYLLGRTPYKRPTDDPNLVWGYGTLDRELTPEELEQVKAYVDGMVNRLSAEEIEKQETSPAENVSKRKAGIKIPVLGHVAAGVPITAVEEVLGYEEIEEGLASTGDFFGLQIKGNSMEPRISEGDVVIVRKQNDIESGDIAIVLVNGDDATCKRVLKHGDGISLISLNPAYPPRVYTAEEIRSLPIQIIGRVMELRAKF